MIAPGLRIYKSDVQANGCVHDSAINRECRTFKVENNFPSELVTALRNFVRQDLNRGPVYVELRIGNEPRVGFHFVEDVSSQLHKYDG